MTTFTDVVDGSDPLGRSTCGYTIAYTVQWRDFYDTVLPITETEIVTWNAADFRYEVQSDDTSKITGDR